MGSRPEGLFSPNSVSATACPPSSPGNQASSMAGMFSCSHTAVTGRPLWITSTTGVPAARTAFTKSSCRPGRSSETRSKFSPQVSVLSPTHTIATSASRAIPTASEKSSRPSQ